MLGMVLFAFGIGYVLSEISFIPDSTENVGAPEALETAEAPDGYLRVELSDMFLRKADVFAGRILDRIVLTLRYENVGTRDIRAFTGVMVFDDLFDRHIKSLNLTYDDPIRAGLTVVNRSKGFEPNQFIDSDQKLMTAELQDLKFRFEMKSIIFSDGTQIGDPQ